MLAANHGGGQSARRRRPVISCRECHRRKEKCDRRQPCARCIGRGKRGACLYGLVDDQAQPPATEPEDTPSNSVLQTDPDAIPTASNIRVNEGFGQLGYANNTKGTLGVIHTLGEPTSLSHSFCSPDGHQASQYANIIRELPSQKYRDILVKAFFNNVAWHYDIVHEATFFSQLSQWSCLSHRQLKEAPDSLPVTLRSFPALLFQVLAQSLLFQPTQYDERLDDLKYTADMKLSDRAAEYSEAGYRLASLFRKNELTLTTVQAEFMRACFEKTTGAVKESWHTLGVAIRDAQELGLHQTEPEPTPDRRAGLLSDRALGCKVWLILHLWDAHMAIVLGRPMSTRMKPADVALPTAHGSGSSAPSPPQPYDIILCGYHTAYKFLQDIHDLEKEEDCRLHVENIHEQLLNNIANLPAWATTHRPRQDEPPWLSVALETMLTNVYFVLFALHRPFIFAEPSSRGRAFHSAIQILESQARLFDRTEPLQYKAFSLVFATFDALVLVTAVHIRFPNEFKEHLPLTKRNLEWGLNRLEVLQTTNNLAGAALGVVQQLYHKMLAVVPPVQSLLLPDRSTESGEAANEVETWEAETLDDTWGDDFQFDMGNMLPPQPLNELLCHGFPTSHPPGQAEPFCAMNQPYWQFPNNEE